MSGRPLTKNIVLTEAVRKGFAEARDLAQSLSIKFITLTMLNPAQSVGWGKFVRIVSVSVVGSCCAGYLYFLPKVQVVVAAISAVVCFFETTK